MKDATPRRLCTSELLRRVSSLGDTKDSRRPGRRGVDFPHRLPFLVSRNEGTIPAPPNRTAESLIRDSDDLLHLSLPRKRHASLPPAPPAKRRRTTPLGNGTKPDGATIVLDLDESDEEVVPLDREVQIESGVCVTSPFGGALVADLISGKGMVTCPACGQNLPLASLNAHLDRGCPPIQAGPTTSSKASWAALFSSAQPPSTGGSRADADAELASKRITKPNYALVSTKELRGLLETYGCATMGERGVLVERVQLWISIFKYVRLFPACLGAE